MREDDAYTNLVLPAALERHRLDARDAAFATELASGTIRRQGTYDAVLAACVDRPLAKVDPVVLDALRLGAHQLLGMRVPAHAAISTTVDLVRARGKTERRRVRNAVLRKVAERDLDAWIAGWRRLAPPTRATTRTATRRGWSRSCAVPSATTSSTALLAADNAPPKVTLVARPGRAERAELPGRADAVLAVRRGARRAATRPRCRRSPRAGPASRTRAPSWWRWLLAAAPVEGPDAAWLDLCAGPGGKSALLAALAAERGAGLLAVERQHAPQPAGRPGARRCRRRAPACVTADGTAPPLPPGSFDRVLVDAPCTGLGALRRRPEARWRRKPEDLDALVPLQRRLLAAALELVRPGGVVLYATCSPVLAETAEVVDRDAAARGPTSVLEDAGAAAARRTRLRRPAARHRPAVAAPARHRRDVHGAAAP